LVIESAKSPSDEDALIEGALLHLVLDLHPDHLSPDELVREMAVDPARTEDDAVRRAIGSLTRAGLVRLEGTVISPTHPARRFAQLPR